MDLEDPMPTLIVDTMLSAPRPELGEKHASTAMCFREGLAFSESVGSVIVSGVSHRGKNMKIYVPVRYRYQYYKASERSDRSRHLSQGLLD